jgi:hypothetical protein
LSDDRLLTLTYALEDAVIRRDWPEVNALFGERGQLLDTAPRLASTNVEAILAADARLTACLESERTSVLTQLRQSRKVSAARNLYAKFK